MTKLYDLGRACLMAFSIALALVPVLEWLGDLRCENVAYAGESITGVAAAILTLQPAVSGERCERLGRIIATASHERDFDPKLITSLIMRESSFRESVELGVVLGTRGEVGLMQLAPRTGQRFAPNRCNFYDDPECNVRTGTRVLDYCRDTCPGSTWRWVAYYGMSRCPSEEAAREDPATRRAYAYYQQLGGTEWDDGLPTAPALPQPEL